MPTRTLDCFGCRAALRPVLRLVAGYVTVSVLTVVAIALLRHHSSAVNSAVWTRGVIVAASSLLTLSFAAGAARGSRRAFLRLRIASAIMLVAIVVIVAIPGSFPRWMKVDQTACGVLLLGVVVIVNRRRIRALFG